MHYMNRTPPRQIRVHILTSLASKYPCILILFFEPPTSAVTWKTHNRLHSITNCQVSGSASSGILIKFECVGSCCRWTFWSHFDCANVCVNYVRSLRPSLPPIPRLGGGLLMKSWQNEFPYQGAWRGFLPRVCHSGREWHNATSYRSHNRHPRKRRGFHGRKKRRRKKRRFGKLGFGVPLFRGLACTSR